MITEGQVRLIAGRYAGRGRDLAYLDLAQEHFLRWMAEEGLFSDGGLVFKGGTAIRKFWLGLTGRFSTDLDFASEDMAYAEHVLESLRDGPINFSGVTIRADEVDFDAGKARWRATVEGMGETMAARIEFSGRANLLPALSPVDRPQLPGLRQDILGFDLPLVPLMCLEENLAEKLARFRRVVKSRDLYDLAALGPRVRESLALIRLITCFKVFFDIARDGLDGLVPFQGGAEYRDRTPNDVDDPDDIGLVLGGRVDLQAMLTTVTAVFGTMGAPEGPLEERLARVDRGDLWWAEQEYQRLRTEYKIEA